MAVGFERIGGFASRIMKNLVFSNFIKKHKSFWMNNYPEKVKHLKKCESSSNLHAFAREFASGFSEFDSYEHYLIENNPVLTWNYCQIPLLIVNANDDMFCVKKSIDDWKHVFTEKNILQNAFLLNTNHGSHCCWYDFWGTNHWFDNALFCYFNAVIDCFYNLKNHPIKLFIDETNQSINDNDNDNDSNVDNAKHNKHDTCNCHCHKNK